MRLSEAAAQEIRISALAARDQCNPHGADCWRIHWPCRALLLVDSLTETSGELAQARAARAKEREEQQYLISLLQGRLERIAFLLETHRALVQKLKARINEAAAQLEGLNA